MPVRSEGGSTPRPARTAGSSFAWTACPPCTPAATVGQFLLGLSEFTIPPELWVLVRMAGEWFVHQENMFPNDASGARALNQYTVRPIRFAGVWVRS